MRFSEKWICDWINPLINVQYIYEQMTQSGLEVEEINHNVLNNLNNVFIGEIISCCYHPDLKDFQILTININQKKTLKIICNKKKYKINMKVVIATCGAILSNDTVIKLVKIGDMYSEGQVCSFHDLNMFGNKKDIIELPNIAPVGIKFYNYDFYIDNIFKINIPPNRMDALGILGIAREISVLNNFPLPKINNIHIPKNIKNTCKIKIEINDIPISYRTMLIKNLNLKITTPLWMKERLRRCHIHSVNIVIDIFNYVFIELGQSFYIFSVSNEINNIFLKFFDVTNHKNYYHKNIVLNNKIIVISDMNKVLSVVGNIDFDIFPVNLNHTTLLIGSVFLDPELLENSLYHLKKNNQNFILNNYNVDPGLQTQAIRYISSLFLKICGGNSGPMIKYISKKYYNYIKIIRLYHKNIKKILGYNINYNIVYNILNNLGYDIIYSNNNFYDISPPTWRLDIKIEVDIISEIVRIYKYDDIFPMPLNNNFPIVRHHVIENTLKRAKYTLIDKGYNEIISYSFVDFKSQNLLYPNKKYLSLINPISQDLSCMRLSLWVGLIKIFLYHQNRQYSEIKLFESGLCFTPNYQKSLGVQQDLLLSGIIGSMNHKKHWDIPIRKLDFYDIKGDVECVLESIGYLNNIDFRYRPVYGLHPHQSAVIYHKNIIIGSIGALHPILLKKFNFNCNVFLFELFWKKISFNHLINMNEISEFPISTRDISILVDNRIFVGDIIQVCKKQFLNDIIDVKIFDIYKGEFTQQGKKSVSLSLVFQNFYKTYEEKEINYMTNMCIDILKKQFFAILRN
ncbi:Phenylalanine--tRNA ligase beta subunit [Buchnera aphidicola (Phyllaphis fagi)]|uniref:phenylalanine--tRNA ligase subunit beta n=1 Tax=Buchnera aphidicola TaxID=9 RepID=UPI003463A629